MNYPFAKGANVTDFARVNRYRVERRHKDGTITVRSIFSLRQDGTDAPGYLGYVFRHEPASLYQALDRVVL